MKKVEILGLNFADTNLSGAREFVFDRLERETTTMVVTANAEFGKLALEDEKIRDLYNGADLLVADGAGVVLAAKILGKTLQGKVAGVDLAAEVANTAAEKALPLFLLGGKPGIAEAAAENLQKKYPGLLIAGTADGYFSSDGERAPLIKNSGAKIVFVCLGSPKQEYFIKNNYSLFDGMLLIGLGGSLDVFAGVSKRAPDFFVKCNLEWFYRLIKQPSRLGRMMKLPAYEFEAVKAKLFKKKGK